MTKLPNRLPEVPDCLFKYSLTSKKCPPPGDSKLPVARPEVPCTKPNLGSASGCKSGECFGLHSTGNRKKTKTHTSFSRPGSACLPCWDNGNTPAGCNPRDPPKRVGFSKIGSRLRWRRCRFSSMSKSSFNIYIYIYHETQLQ